MGLFGFGKKKEEVKGASCCAPAKETKAASCCAPAKETKAACGCAPAKEIKEACGCAPAKEAETACSCGGEGCRIKVLGGGCRSCHDQFENVQAAVRAMGLDAKVEFITDMEKVMVYGVMSMPAIVVNEKVVSAGKTLKAGEVESLLKKLGC